ncbi:MAG: zinc ABC transporter substrate-binding protein [Chloroflexi bacterium]|nr:zinc ABC transporter substrate-binding protein [Chloroflexota bacterium]
MFYKLFAASLIALAAAVLVACSPAAAPAPAPTELPASSPSTTTSALNVVSTVSPITSVVENIGGTRINLIGVVPEGVNSHTFDPAPSVAATLSQADLIFLNGLFLEEPTLEMAKANLKPGASIVSLGEQTISRDQWEIDFSFPE